MDTPTQNNQQSSILPLIESAYQSIEDAIQRLVQLEQAFYDQRDRRAIFVTAYLNITRAVKLRVEENWFQDNPWATRYDISFANLYREALLAFERGDVASLPKAWRISFETAVNGTGLVFQDLVLGINAHINHDLPLALTEVTIDPERAKRYQDHTAVNQVLQAATNLLKDRISSMYAPVLSILDQAFNPLDQALTSFSIDKARESAWVDAVALANAQTDQERAAIRLSLDDQSAVLARLILAPTAPNPLLVSALRQLESITPWWTYITLPEISGKTTAPVVSEPLAVNSLDELVSKLKEIIARYDSQRSKMSVYPTIYLQITQKIKEAIDGGQVFEDGAWLTSLSLHFATQYLRVLASFETGSMGEVPQCWAITFQATTNEQATILQDVILAANAQLNHDLAIALLRAGITDETEKRRRDLERMHSIFVAEFKPIQDLLAQKYSQFFKFLEVIGGQLEEMVADFAYIRARDGAWENALTLSGASSQEQCQALIQEMDKRATVLAQNILLRQLPASAWIIQVLRHVESAYNEPWSKWVSAGG
ncbi:MAG: hypothetical protein NVSMB27_43920 [Ktedonobacteraceae bacterium]